MDRKGKHEVKEIPAGRPQCHPWILFAWAPNLALFVAQLAGECSFVHPSLPQVLSLPASPLVPASVLHSTVLIASERMPASATGNFAPSQALDPSPPPGTQPLYCLLAPTGIFLTLAKNQVPRAQRHTKPPGPCHIRTYAARLPLPGLHPPTAAPDTIFCVQASPRLVKHE